MKEISAGGVVYRCHQGEFQLLLIEDRFGHITFPKGKQEKNETKEMNALREIYEETGIQGKIVKPIMEINYEYQHPIRGKVEKEVTYFLVEALSGNETPQLEEIQDATWYSLNVAKKLHAEKGYENNDIVLKKAIEMLEGGVVLPKNLASMIDHTLLKPEATREQIEQLCQEAKRFQFASVCVNPYWVKFVSEQLQGSKVKVCTVIGFPLGATTTESKAFETKQAVADGADELDMVINIGALRSGELQVVKEDIQAVVAAANGKTVKVILETGLLTAEEIRTASRLSQEAGANFVKTSTGFGPGGATVETVRIMRETAGKSMGVKASGGIRDLKTAQAMVEAGASRIGTSASVKIIQE